MLDHGLLAQLETPCLVVDMAAVRRNIEAMQREADASGCALRPHIKTHKLARLARMQVEAGAQGIACAKVSEAEIMADGGIDDIFIAYPMVGAFRIKRAIALHRRVRRLILAVDSAYGADALSEAASRAGMTLEIRLEIDLGRKRTGVPKEESVALARHCKRLPCLNLTGVFGFKGLMYRETRTGDASLAAEEEADTLQCVAAAMREEGIDVTDISGGSSPTGMRVARTGKVTEIRPGTYIYGDATLIAEGVMKPEDAAVRYYATVVSTPRPGYAVIDGGSKTFAQDTTPNTPPFSFPGYALVDGHPGVELSWMNEEHGVLTAATGAVGLNVGEVISLLPLHVCTAVNMFNDIVLLENGALTKVRIDARGALQ